MALGAEGEAASLGWLLAIHDQLDSTNLEVKRRLRAGETPPFAVLALRQTQGYGRQGRTWTSPFGGLYLSLAYRPNATQDRWPTLCLVTGLAVRQAIVRLDPTIAEALLVKWPNDLVVAADGGYAKLCGISTETCARSLCIGVGVNVVPPAEEAAAPTPPYPVAYVDTLRGGNGVASGPGPEAVCEQVETLAGFVLEACSSAFSLWEEAGFSAFAEDYNAHNALKGREVTIADIELKHELTGTAGTVGPDGRLELRLADGSVRMIESGEAHIRRCLSQRTGTLQ